MDQAGPHAWHRIGGNAHTHATTPDGHAAIHLAASSLLWYDPAVPIDPAAFMEAVTHHALCEQKKDECQDDYEQQRSDSDSE
jgi:hypothetical protein